MEAHKLVEMQKLATAAADAAATYQAATQAAGAKEAQLLRALIEAVRPGLPAIVRGVRVSHTRRWNPETREYDDLHGDAAVGGERVRAVLVAGDVTPRKDLPGAPGGEYLGRALYVLEDGRLAEQRYAGTWAKAGEVTSQWTAPLEVLEESEALKTWRLEDVVKGLHAKLTAYNREKPTAAALRRAAKAEAVLILMQQD